MPRKNRARRAVGQKVASARLGRQDVQVSDVAQEQQFHDLSTDQYQLLAPQAIQKRAHQGHRRSGSPLERPHRGEFGHRKNPKRIQQGKQLASKRLGKLAGNERQGEQQAAALIE
uniref:Uncharacterized protein n=1 Tax=Acrobeloides nanus TaxID=290746 RepID=A0A914DI48_9BILA